MCKFFSLVLTKDAAHWLPNSDSHQDIIERCGLHADGVRGPNILKIEIVPPADCDWANLSKWRYAIDQDQRPEWHDAEHDKARAIAVLEKRAQDWPWLPAVSEARKIAFEAATCTDPARRFAAMLAAKRYYELGGFKGEPTIHWCNTPQERDSLRVSLRVSLRDSLRVSLRDSLRVSLWVSLWDSLWDSLRDSLRVSLWDSLRVSLRVSLRDSLWDSELVASRRVAIATGSATLSDQHRNLLDAHTEIVTNSFAPWMCDGHIVLCERPSHVEIVAGNVVDMKWER
jgi:hypothetical protein